MWWIVIMVIVLQVTGKVKLGAYTIAAGGFSEPVSENNQLHMASVTSRLPWFTFPWFSHIAICQQVQKGKKTAGWTGL